MGHAPRGARTRSTHLPVMTHRDPLPARASGTRVAQPAAGRTHGCGVLPPSFRPFFPSFTPQVASVTRLSPTSVVFVTSEVGQDVFIAGGEANVVARDPATGESLRSTKVCAGTVDCASLTVDSQVWPSLTH